MVDGKAKLMRDDYCDGLGNVRRFVRPVRLVSKQEKPRLLIRQLWKKIWRLQPAPSGGCPGSRSKAINRTLRLQWIPRHRWQFSQQKKVHLPSGRYRLNWLTNALTCTVRDYSSQQTVRLLPCAISGILLKIISVSSAVPNWMTLIIPRN